MLISLRCTGQSLCSFIRLKCTWKIHCGVCMNGALERVLKKAARIEGVVFQSECKSRKTLLSYCRNHVCRNKNRCSRLLTRKPLNVWIVIFQTVDNCVLEQRPSSNLAVLNDSFDKVDLFPAVMLLGCWTQL